MSKSNLQSQIDKMKDDILKTSVAKAQTVIEKLVNDCVENLEKKYKECLSDFYNEPRNVQNPYTRIYNLKQHSYYKQKAAVNGNHVIGSFHISDRDMDNYINRKGNVFTAEALLDKYIYTDNGTYHGGDWYGGYGEQANINIKETMETYWESLRNGLISKHNFKQL